MPKNLERLYKYTTYFLLLGVIAAMVVYQTLIFETKPKKNPDGTIKEP